MWILTQSMIVFHSMNGKGIRGYYIPWTTQYIHCLVQRSFNSVILSVQESEENQITLAFCKAFYLFSMLVDFWESRKFSMWAKKCITNKYNDALQNIKFNKLYDKKIMIK